MKLHRAAFACILLAGTTSCASIEVHDALLRTPEPSRTMHPALLAETPPNVYDVALLQGVCINGEEADLVRAMRLRAQQLGCDAVARVRLVASGARLHMTGYCVRFQVDPAAAPPSEAGLPDAVLPAAAPSEVAPLTL